MQQHSEAFDIIFVIMAVVLAIIFILIAVMFAYSCYKTMKGVPEDQRRFPAWFCWMFLVPVAGYVFMWIMLPFGIPNSLKDFLADNSTALADAKTLFGLGLSHVILILLSMIPVIGVVAGIAAIVVYIIYWIKVVSFRKHFPKSS